MTIRSKIKGNELTKATKLNEIMKVMSERNPHDYQNGIEQLLNDESTKSFMETLIAQRTRIFYCEIENSFIGINRTNC